MTNEEKSNELLHSIYNKNGNGAGRIRGYTGDEVIAVALEMATWKEQQFTKIGYTKEQLRAMGFGFTLNGDIVTPKEEDELIKEYLNYQKQKAIEKAAEWWELMLRGSANQEGIELLIEDFKQAMKGEGIFPELKESEDERIRKLLIELVKEFRKLNPTNADNNAECSEAIAWLEKQGEKFSEKPKWYDSMDELIADALIELVKSSDLIERDKRNRIYWINKHRENISKWSEEDERILNGLISSLVRIGASTRTDSTSINYTFSKEIDWLKSLKPNHWKPSEEEIRALESLTVYAPYSSQVEILNHLLDELKTLRDYE